MQIAEPGYYQQFTQQLKGAKQDDFYFFMSYLTGLDESDWREFLRDLFLEKSYPALIQRVKRDYSILSYYAIFIGKMPEEKKIMIDRAINSIAREELSKDLAGENIALSNSLTFSRLLMRGISSEVLIHDLIISSNPTIKASLRFEAATTLSHYSDLLALDFFKYQWKELLPEMHRYGFLAFPRFNFLSKMGTQELLEGFASLQYFEFDDYITLDDIILPLEDFFQKVHSLPVQWEAVRNMYSNFSKELKKVISENILLPNGYSDLNSLLQKDFFSLTPNDSLQAILASVNSKMIWRGVWANLDSVSKPNLKILNHIARKTNPYDAFENSEIAAIDPDFIRKSHIFTHINRGRKYFKQSQFGKAIACYNKALTRIKSIKHPDNLTTYFHSWMLHEIGNINFVLQHYNEAKVFYLQSYHIKNTIEEIPKEFLYATQLKILAAFLVTSNYSPEYIVNIRNLVAQLTRYKRDLPTTQHVFLDCLLGDAHYYLTRAHHFVGEPHEFKFHFDTSLRFAIKNKDLTGKVELYVLGCLAQNSNRYVSEIRQTFSEMSAKQKKNPYLCTLLESYEGVNKQLIVWQELRKEFANYISPVDVSSISAITPADHTLDGSLAPVVPLVHVPLKSGKGK